MSLGSVERTESRHAAAFDVEIASVATAVPIHRIEQAAIVERSRLYYRQFGHMESLYSNVGIATRYFCEPMRSPASGSSSATRSADFSTVKE